MPVEGMEGIDAVFPLPKRGTQVLALGAEVNSTLCFIKNNWAYVSVPLGDLEDYRNFLLFEKLIREGTRRLEVTPDIIAYDLHPEYLSTKFALELPGEVPLIGVQHHHAHLAACLFDNGLEEEVIGVAFDGTGYGLDGCLWGGEFLVGNSAYFTRWAHLAYLPIPSGSLAIKEPWRMGAQYLDETFGAGMMSLPLQFVERLPNNWELLKKATAKGINAPLTSSCGRLFDGVAAVVLGLYGQVSFEGEGAMMLEKTAAPEEKGHYPHTVSREVPFQVDWRPLWQALVEDLQKGTGQEIVSARFHNTVANIILEVTLRISEETGIKKVALTGGVFQNRYLLQRTVAHLTNAGLAVLLHRRLPPSDRSISVGQAMIALAKE